MTNYKLLLQLGLALAFVSLQAQKKPNLIIVHTDEHNFRTLSCYQKLLSEEQAFVWGKGNNVDTPNIDRIANEGAICTSYYASSPVCTPSRSSVVTGLYPQATGAPKNGLHIREDIPTFATILRDNGYATAYVGKWHLAGHEKYTFGIKYKAGFEDNRYMMRGGHAPYFHIKGDKIRGINEKIAANLPKEEVVHLTDFFTDKTLEILERDKNKPFALMVSIPDPHTPDYAKPPYDKMYNHMDIQRPATMDPKYTAVKPSWAKPSKNKKDKNEATGKNGFDKQALQQYFGMVKHIDDSVGKILKFLDDNKLSDDTIIIFTSDHGDMFFEHNRRNKNVPYEASSRIPFVIRYPNKINAGKVIETAYTNVDFAPTILSLMGVETKAKFHGSDTSEDFLNCEKKVKDENRITYFAKTGGWWVAAVTDRYKLILDKSEKPYLFDLEKDPNELINFYGDKDYKEIGEKLQKELFVMMNKYEEPGLIKMKNRPYVTE
ncbi:sulfatase family protein [Wenyingzhuangia sp. IMCC45533]